MFVHNKRLQYTVRVSAPNPGLANLMLEQFGGPQGELAAACRYFTQAVGEDDPGRKDLLFDIATEELSHLEVIGSIVAMLNKGAKGQLAEAVESEAELYRSLTGGGHPGRERGHLLVAAGVCGRRGDFTGVVAAGLADRRSCLRRVHAPVHEAHARRQRQRSSGRRLPVVAGRQRPGRRNARALGRCGGRGGAVGALSLAPAVERPGVRFPGFP